MSLTDPTAHSEAMLGYHDPTLGVGIDAPRDSGGATGADEEGFFSTLLDIINPLQHIPLVSSLYREITGDQISPTARIVGGGLFGGPIGLASASANAIFEQASGDDILGHAVAMFADGAEADVTPQQAGTPIIHQQADAGGHTDSAAATDIVMAGPSALAGPKAATVATNAPVSLVPPVTAPPAPAPQQARSGKYDPAAPVDQATNSGPQNSPAAVATAAPADRAAETDAFLGTLPTNWVNEALRDAATMNQALQNGAAPETGTAKPWVGNAMLDALNKYDALTRARDAQPGNGPS